MEFTITYHFYDEDDNVVENISLHTSEDMHSFLYHFGFNSFYNRPIEENEKLESYRSHQHTNACICFDNLVTAAKKLWKHYRITEEYSRKI